MVRVLTQIEPQQFIQLVQPLLEANDLSGLLALLKQRWAPQDIVDLLRSDHIDARKLALLALGLVGERCCVRELAHQLRDPDPAVNGIAEHALWSIWFRSGKSCQANRQLKTAADAMNRRDFATALSACDEAIRLDPDFAEAYNQRAIAYYLQEDFRQSIADCQRAAERMPCHFGAWAGMGHCYAHLGQHRQALECYEQALEINPHLDCVRQTVGEIRRKTGMQSEN
jgi:tetratricopeptide (TPR) repeat protein